MIQEIAIPKDAQLRKLINFMSYVKFTEGDSIDSCCAIFPNATSNLVLSLDTEIEINRSKSMFSLYATCTSTVAIRPYIGMAFITVQFNHYGLNLFSKIPAFDLRDSHLTLDTFFTCTEIDSLVNRVGEAKDIPNKFDEVESFLLKHLAEFTFDPRLSAAITLLREQQSLRSKVLADKLCLSERAIQKLFKQHVGISPSMLKKIFRFNEAAQRLLHLDAHSLTDLAFQCGYYDQSHFIRDFKRLATITPSDFLKLRAKSSEFYNFNLHTTE